MRGDAPPIRILAHSGGFVFVSKPPELPTEPERPGAPSARGALADALGISESRINAVSSLGVGVSGVVAFARTAEARRRAVALRDHGELSRSYIGIAAAPPNRETDSIGSWRGKVDGLDAETRWRVVALCGELALPSGSPLRPTLLALSPVTSQHHQIRIQAAQAKAPLLGDPSHGGPDRLVRADGRVVETVRVALHALRLVLPRATREALVVTAPVPRDLVDLWRELDGDDGAWRRAGATAAEEEI